MNGFRVFDVKKNCYPENQQNFYLDVNGKLHTLRRVDFDIKASEEVDPARYIVEFSTGIKGKNGKEIFEGDMKGNKVVLFNKDLALYCLHYKSNSGEYKPASYPMFSNEIEITGTIHDTEEMKCR